uniref:BTB domain-containing protein n=1 Tax=Oryza punctata TaxID=4537 RepID=A0A0E0JJA7_ORYPU
MTFSSSPAKRRSVGGSLRLLRVLYPLSSPKSALNPTRVAAGGFRPCRPPPARQSVAVGLRLLKNDGYSLTKGTPNGSSLSSSQFIGGDHRWRIKYYPNGFSASSADYISLFLLLDVKVKVQAKWSFQISYTGQVDRPPSLATMKVDTFAEGSWSWGHAKLIKREDFEKSNDLRDNSFTIRCDIVIIREIRAEITTTTPTSVTVPPSDLNQQLGDLLESEKGADVVFEVGSHTFAAHRCVLTAWSPVFKAELDGLMKEGDTCRVVHIKDMEVRVFKVLLRFMYTDSLPQMKEEDVMCQHLLIAAGLCNLERPKLICEEKLCRYISVGTVPNILVLADQHHCDGLKKACFSFLCSPANLSAVVAGDGFKHLCRSCL